MYFAEDLIASGGPSAPVWAFITTTTLALIALLGQNIAAKRAAVEARIKAAEANEAAQKAVEQTKNTGNGFAGDVVGKLDKILVKQDALDESLRGHLEWHMKHTP
jgi:heme exporter protein D